MLRIKNLVFKPTSVGSSVAPVPSELVGAIANNEYIDFQITLTLELGFFVGYAFCVNTVNC